MRLLGQSTSNAIFLFVTVPIHCDAPRPAEVCGCAHTVCEALSPSWDCRDNAVRCDVAQAVVLGVSHQQATIIGHHDSTRIFEVGGVTLAILVTFLTAGACKQCHKYSSRCYDAECRISGTNTVLLIATIRAQILQTSVDTLSSKALGRARLASGSVIILRSLSKTNNTIWKKQIQKKIQFFSNCIM